MSLVAVSTPPLAVPPSSCTRNVKLAYGEPLALAAGMNLKLPPVRSPIVTVKGRLVILTPLFCKTPLVGSEVIFTAASELELGRLIGSKAAGW